MVMLAIELFIGLLGYKLGCQNAINLTICQNKMSLENFLRVEAV
tara:strand:- start:88646 stop:88777 length:132 start_codon:yes stop_codon:yes gene_type:complete